MHGRNRQRGARCGASIYRKGGRRRSNNRIRANWEAVDQGSCHAAIRGEETEKLTEVDDEQWWLQLAKDEQEWVETTEVAEGQPEGEGKVEAGLKWQATGLVQSRELRKQ